MNHKTRQTDRYYTLICPDGADYGQFPTEAAARAALTDADGICQFGSPHRVAAVERVTSYDLLPEPEPLPELPAEVWCSVYQLAPGGVYGPYIGRPTRRSDLYRDFVGTVSEWVEVTE